MDHFLTIPRKTPCVFADLAALDAVLQALGVEQRTALVACLVLVLQAVARAPECCGQACEVLLGASTPRQSGRRGLAPMQVKAIRSDPRPLTEIGASYGISSSAVSMIRRRKSYGDPQERPLGKLRARPCRLPPDIVEAIRANTRPVLTLAQALDLSPQTIYRVLNRKGAYANPA